MAERMDHPVGDLEFGQKVQLTRSLMPSLPSFGFVERLSFNGKVWIFSDADENDRVTGQTSFAATTPTWMIDVPAGMTLIPLFVNLTQAGTVAGGDVSIRISIDSALRHSSGGTSEKGFNARTNYGGNPPVLCRSGATATSGYGIRLFSAVTAPDVSPAEGAVQGPYWSAEVPMFLDGPASFLVYTEAGTTGPTWEWTIGVAADTTARINALFGE